jgi:phosphatidate cytidylyltransferase
MLRTRVLTALVLPAVLVLILYVNSYRVFALAAAVFLGAAAWENLRMFGVKAKIVGAVLWVFAFLIIAYLGAHAAMDARMAGLPPIIFALSAILWMVRLAPTLALGLPAPSTVGNNLLNGLYGFSILGCFVAMLALFEHSTLYLFSVLAIVWIAALGAYFSGKAFGKRKLAPSISPGKSWEGVIGGWCAVLLAAAGSLYLPFSQDTFAAGLLASWGWGWTVLALTLIVAASVVGDLFESQLKRRAGMKDSSNLLPGHGGVLDRIDALIPALPMAALLAYCTKPH